MRQSFRTYGTHVSYIKGLLAEWFSISQCETHMEMQINAALCLARLEPALHACSAAASFLFFKFFFFFFIPLGTEWEGRTRGWYSFVNHHRLNCMICFPPEGTLMIPRQNDICLRPTGMARPDDISTGIMSGGISSAPVRWAGEVWKARRGGITCKHDSVCDQMQNEAWNKCSFCRCLLFCFESCRDYARHSGLQVNLTEQYPLSSFWFW